MIKENPPAPRRATAQMASGPIRPAQPAPPLSPYPHPITLTPPHSPHSLPRSPWIGIDPLSTLVSPSANPHRRSTPSPAATTLASNLLSFPAPRPSVPPLALASPGQTRWAD